MNDRKPSIMEARRSNGVWYQCLVIFLTLFTFLLLTFVILLNILPLAPGIIISGTVFEGKLAYMYITTVALNE